LDKKERFKAFILVFTLIGIYFFIFSESGLLERRELNKKFNTLTEKINYLKTDNQRLLHEYEKYRSGNYSDNDIISSGLITKNGKLLYTDETGKEKDKERSIIQEDFSVSTEHLRIIWILISIVTLFYYFLNKKKSEETSDGSDFN